MRPVTAYRAAPEAIQHLAPVVPADWPLDRSYCGIGWLVSECEPLEFTAPPDPQNPPPGVCKTCWRVFASGDWESNSW